MLNWVPYTFSDIDWELQGAHYDSFFIIAYIFKLKNPLRPWGLNAIIFIKWQQYILTWHHTGKVTVYGSRSGAIPSIYCTWYNSNEGLRLKVAKNNFQSQPLNKKILKRSKKLKMYKKFVKEMV